MHPIGKRDPSHAPHALHDAELPWSAAAAGPTGSVDMMEGERPLQRCGDWQAAHTRHTRELEIILRG